MPSTDHLSRREARWLALAGQGLARERPVAKGRGTGRARLRKVMQAVGTIQVDAVNVLERTQFIVPFSRVGGYERADFRTLSGPGGEWFEYWGHAASLLPVELYPLFRWRMERWRQDMVDSPVVQERRQAWRQAHASYLAAVLAEVTERGPMAASQLSEPRRRVGEWWDRRSDGRRALELLFGDGVLTAWRSANFERVYDLSERALPPGVLSRPAVPAEEAQRELLAIAAGCLGVATVGDLAEYFWLRPRPAAQRVAELVEEGRLVPVAVEGWRQPAYVLPGARPRPPVRATATLLSPFDSLIWTRDRTERLFGVRYRIEIYVPGPQRTFGYYVLPLLLGDELVARFDLKSDRKAGALNVVASYAEPAHPAGIAEPALAELHRLRQWLGLSWLSIAPKGDLAAALALYNP